MTDWDAFDEIMEEARELAMGDGWTKEAVAALEVRLEEALGTVHQEAMEEFYRLKDWNTPRE